MSSNKTTAGGVVAILGGLGALIPSLIALIDGDPETAVDIETTSVALAGIGAGIAGLFARDNDVSDQEAGTRTEGGGAITKEQQKINKKKKKGKLRKMFGRVFVIGALSGSLVLAPLGCVRDEHGNRAVDHEALEIILKYSLEYGPELVDKIIDLAKYIDEEQAAKDAAEREAAQERTEAFIKTLETVLPEVREIVGELRDAEPTE